MLQDFGVSFVIFIVLFIAIVAAYAIYLVVQATRDLRAEEARPPLDEEEANRRLDASIDRLAWPRYLAGVFVFIGLFGTVVGMAIALLSLAGTMGESRDPASEFRSVTEGIRGLLGGMWTAFFSTCAGILATLAVSYCNQYYLSKVQGLERQWQDLPEPAEAPGGEAESEASPESAAVQAIREGIATLTHEAKRLGDSVAGFRETVPKTAADLSAAAGATKQAIDGANSLRESLQTLAQQAASAHQSTVANLERVTGLAEHAAQVIKGGSENLSAVAGSIERSAKVYEQDREQALKGVAEAAAAIRDNAALIRESAETHHGLQMERTDALVAGVQAAQTRLDNLLARFEETLTEVAALSEKAGLGSAVAGASQRISASVQTLERVSEAQQRLERQLEETVQAQQRSGQELRQEIASTLAGAHRAATQEAVLCVTDEFTRESLALEVGRSFRSEQVCQVLEELFASRGTPAALRMDNGPEFIALVLKGLCYRHRINGAYIEPGKPWHTQLRCGGAERLCGEFHLPPSGRVPGRRSVLIGAGCAGSTGPVAQILQRRTAAFEDRVSDAASLRSRIE